MKKILLGLFFAMFAMQVNAAVLPFTLTVENDSSSDGTAVVRGNSLSSGGFDAGAVVNDEWGYSSSRATGVLSITSFNPDAFYRVTIKNELGGIVATSDFSSTIAQELAFDYTTVNVMYSIFVDSIDQFGALAALSTTGYDTTTYDIKIHNTPIPAAVWLFGSALMGLFGVSRRKSTAVAA